MYHSAWDKYGDILAASGNWITCRFDGEKGTNCYEVDAPYIKVFISEENPKPEPIYDIAELVKDKARLDWILSDAGNALFASSRKDIDKEMEETQ